LITLRGYLLITATLIIIKITQLALGIGGQEGSGSDSDALARTSHPVAVATSTR
jgi:hypothetical protein